MKRLDLFDGLPGVWQRANSHEIVWQQIRRQLKTGGDLNKSERLALLELLDRVAASPKARKALGIRLKPRTAARNEQMADVYCRERFAGKSHFRAEEAVREAFPRVGYATVRAVIQSNKWLARGNTHALATPMLKVKGKTP